MTKSIIIPAQVCHPVKQFLDDAGLSCADVARYLGNNYTTAWLIVNGRRKTTFTEEKKLRELIDAIVNNTLIVEGRK